MPYVGQTVNIPLGDIGLRTDDAATRLPPNALRIANNIRFIASRIEKDAGTQKLTDTALGNSIVSLFDWWPTSQLQRLIAVTDNGSIYRDTGDFSFNSQTAITTGLGAPTTDAMMVAGGQEQAGNNRKLFIFTGTGQVQVLSGDGSSTSDIGTPPTDWTSNFPSFGINHAGKLWAFGNSNSPHQIYYSTDDDHEDFTGSGSGSIFVFPGESDKLVSGVSYKNRLFLFKRPFGAYLIDTSDPSESNWRVYKLSDYFGMSSPNAITTVLDDLLAGNSTGSITSVKATDALGDVEAGDILANAQIEAYVREQINIGQISKMSALYYAEKKTAYFSYAAAGEDDQNRMLVVDVNRQTPRYSFITKDSVTCLALRRDEDNIPRPIYGDSAGNVYAMDSTEFNIAGEAYNGEFRTTDTDFSFLEPSLAVKNKIFDFVTLVYKQQSLGSLTLEYYIDGRLIESLAFSQSTGVPLGEFELDTDVLGGTEAVRIRRKLSGRGKTISFRVFNNNLNESFSVEQVIVEMRVGDETNT